MEIVSAGPERLDELEPLWKALHAHHGSLAPRLAGREIRSPDEAWTLRRRQYEAWLAEPDAFCLLAVLDGRAVGYAMVTLGSGLQGWSVGPRVADLQSLSVLPEARGAGVGTRLMDAVDDALRRLGVEDLRLLVISDNQEAIHFYERRGLTTISHVMLGRVYSG